MLRSRVHMSCEKLDRKMLVIKCMLMLLTLLEVIFANQTPARDACVEIMRQLGHYDFDHVLTTAERPVFSWISREEEQATRRLQRNLPAIPSLCNQVLLKYPEINSPSVPHERRVRMLVDFVYRVIPWREKGVEDGGVEVYEFLSSPVKKNDENVPIQDLAAAFLFYESGAGSVVCGGYAWLLSYTLQYFGYWGVVLDSKFKNSYFSDDEGGVVNGHQTVMARVCDDAKKTCKWVHLDASIGSVIVHKSSQDMASFFQVIESFYALQSNEGFEVVPAWTEPPGAPQARSIVSEIFIAQNCQQFWTLLDECNSHLNLLDIPGRSDAKFISAPRTMRNMVSELVLPGSITTWWFHTMPRNSEQYDYGNHGAQNDFGDLGEQNRYDNLGESYCLEQKIASVKPTCYGNGGCAQINDNDVMQINFDLMKKIDCPESNFGSYRNEGRMRYFVRDAELRYFVWLMRCQNMNPEIFAGPDGVAVQLCRDQVQSQSNRNPVTRPQPYTRPDCVAKFEAYPNGYIVGPQSSVPQSSVPQSSAVIAGIRQVHITERINDSNIGITASIAPKNVSTPTSPLQVVDASDPNHNAQSVIMTDAASVMPAVNAVGFGNISLQCCLRRQLPYKLLPPLVTRSLEAVETYRFACLVVVFIIVLPSFAVYRIAKVIKRRSGKIVR